MQIRNIFCYDGSWETLAPVAQFCGRTPISGYVQDEIGLGSAHPDLEEDVAAPLKIPSNPEHSMIL